MPPSSWRSTTRTGYVTTLTAFQSANPTLVDRVLSARPESLSETRTIFINGMTEPIALDSGTWSRTLDVEIVVARHLNDNLEATADLDEMADAVIEWLAADAQAHCLADNTEQHPIRSQSAEIAEGAIFIPAVFITCRASIQQGRQ